MALDHDDVDKFIPEFEDPSTAYLQYVEAQGGKMISPLTPEGLELQAAYLLQLGTNNHPFDVLRKISLNPFASPRDRISASKTLLEYMSRKVPAGIEVAGANGQPIQLSPDVLKKLSGAELDQLAELLEKANNSK